MVGGLLGHLIFVVVSLYLHFNLAGHDSAGVSLSLMAAIAYFAIPDLRSGKVFVSHALQLILMVRPHKDLLLPLAL